MATGGQDCAGIQIDGSDGQFQNENRALGGRGGAGRIRINTRDGSAALQSTPSPSHTTPCVTLGTLTE